MVVYTARSFSGVLFGAKPGPDRDSTYRGRELSGCAGSSLMGEKTLAKSGVRLHFHAPHEIQGYLQLNFCSVRERGVRRRLDADQV